MSQEKTNSYKSYSIKNLIFIPALLLALSFTLVMANAAKASIINVSAAGEFEAIASYWRFVGEGDSVPESIIETFPFQFVGQLDSATSMGSAFLSVSTVSFPTVTGIYQSNDFTRSIVNDRSIFSGSLFRPFSDELAGSFQIGSTSGSRYSFNFLDTEDTGFGNVIYRDFMGDVPSIVITETTVDVPEPTTMALMGLGLMGLVGTRRKKQS